ncbi:MAG: isoprenyl transferase, partial [Candidatus Latescibacteria bacterium]|nr:isoprenyl transferase [Candidatus Latescibacterota bacterium]
IAMIMDGDGRWASKRGLPRTEGHRAGRESVRDVVRACGELGVEVLTLYTFSTENWYRPRSEVRTLMRLLQESLIEEMPELQQNNVRLIAIGRVHRLPSASREALKNAIAQTSRNTGLILNLALNYGGRAEIIDAVRKLAGDVLQGEVKVSRVDEELFQRYLYTADLPDPDLLIRTSGEIRLSNFLLWQMAYTEIWVTDVLWPDFRREHLYEAIQGYQTRERRFGRTSAQVRQQPSEYVRR